MKNILHETILKFRSHLEMMLEDIKLEQEEYELAFYFDTGHIQRAALGYKDYYRDDSSFRRSKFKDDITLVCSLISGGFIGQFRLLPPHQDEFLTKIYSGFDGTVYDDWREEIHKFVADTELDLNPDEFLSQLQSQSEEDLIKRFTEYIETTKRGFNVSHCLLPWDRRLAGWGRKKLLFVEEKKPDYDAIFSSPEFEALKNALDDLRQHKINNFIDATALSILILQVREFKDNKSKLVPRFFLPRSEGNNFRIALTKTNLLSELEYSFDDRVSSVLRNEEYFFYRAYFLQKHRNEKAETPPEWGEQSIEQLYLKVSEIVDRKAFDTVDQIDFDDNSLQDIIDGMENYSFLKNVWIEFINSGELKEILKDLESIKQQFEEARKSYEVVSFAKQVKDELKKIRKNIFENLDEVKRASVLWEEINKVVMELRTKISNSSWDADALFRNRKLFRYGFPQKCHDDIKHSLSLLLSNEAAAESTQKATGKIVSLYMKARSTEEQLTQDQLTVIAAVFCALELKDKLKKLLERFRRKPNLHYSLKIALAGAELDSNNYENGKRLIDELEKLYYSENTRAVEKGDLAVGLTYLYYYAWLARKRDIERQDIHATEDPGVNHEIHRLINNAIVFAERATSLVSNRQLAQRIYAYNQYLFCLVESENPENNKKMKEVFSKLNEYRSQADVWSYMYYDTLSRYFRWRALGQTDSVQTAAFMKEAIMLSNDAIDSAPNDEEIKKFHTKLIDEIDTIEYDA